MERENGPFINRGIRILLTVVFSFLAFFSFTSFLISRSFRAFVQYDYIGELNKRIDVEKIIVEKIAESLGSDVVDPDGSVAEAITGIASSELGVELDEEVVEEVLENKEVLSDFVGYAASISAASETGEVDFDLLAQGFLDIVQEHSDVIGDVSGFEINEENIDQIQDTIEAISDNVGGITIEKEERISQETLDKFGKANEISSLVRGKASRVSFWTNRLMVYGILALGIIFCIVIIFINKDVLSDGFRGCGLVCIITALINSVGALVIWIISSMSGAATELILENFPDVSILGEALGEVISDVCKSVSTGLLIPCGIFLFIGIGLMIASGVSLANEREQMAEQRFRQ